MITGRPSTVPCIICCPGDHWFPRAGGSLRCILSRARVARYFPRSRDVEIFKSITLGLRRSMRCEFRLWERFASQCWSTAEGWSTPTRFRRFGLNSLSMGRKISLLRWCSRIRCVFHSSKAASDSVYVVDEFQSGLAYLDTQISYEDATNPQRMAEHIENAVSSLLCAKNLSK